MFASKKCHLCGIIYPMEFGHKCPQPKEINMFDKVKKALGLNPRNPSAIPQEAPEIKIAVGLNNNHVVINFGKEISFITMDKIQCISLIEALSRTAALIKVGGLGRDAGGSIISDK